jgi:hypothetical protein
LLAQKAAVAARAAASMFAVKEATELALLRLALRAGAATANTPIMPMTAAAVGKEAPA